MAYKQAPATLVQPQAGCSQKACRPRTVQANQYTPALYDSKYQLIPTRSFPYWALFVCSSYNRLHAACWKPQGSWGNQPLLTSWYHRFLRMLLLVMWVFNIWRSHTAIYKAIRRWITKTMVRMIEGNLTPYKPCNSRPDLLWYSHATELYALVYVSEICSITCKVLTRSLQYPPAWTSPMRW